MAINGRKKKMASFCWSGCLNSVSPTDCARSLREACPHHGAACPTPEDILRALQDHSLSRPDKVATRFGQRTRTFAELEDLSTKLSYAMLAPPNFEVPFDVAVCVSSLDDTILCGIASLKLGACCIPLCMTWCHIGTVIDEVPPSCIVIDNVTAPMFKRGRLSEPQMVNIDEVFKQGHHESKAYQPSFKPHRPMLHLLSDTGERTGLTAFRCMTRVKWERETYPFKNDEVVTTTYDFDSANFWIDVVGAMYVGATVVLPTKEQKKAVPNMVTFLVEHKVTRLLLNSDKLASVARYHRVEPDLYTTLSLRVIKCVGGLLPVSLAEKCRTVFPKAVLVYLYDHFALSCYYDCTGEGLLQHQVPEGQFITLGRPVGHCKAYVKDSSHVDCNAGTVGRIHLSECEGHVPVFTGDTGFLDEHGNLFFVSRASPTINGKKTDITVLARCVADIHGIDDVILCWEKFTSYKTSLLAFYWSDTGVLWGEVLRHLVRKVPQHWVPKLFCMGPRQLAGHDTDIHYHSQKSLLKEYSEAMHKLASCSILSFHQGAQILFLLSRLLQRSVLSLDMSASYMAQGATLDTCSKAAKAIRAFGFYAEEQDLRTLPLSTVVPTAVKTLFSPGVGVLRTSLVDNTTSFEDVSTLLSNCFVTKNRLDVAVGNTHEQHVNALRQTWPDFVSLGVSRVALDANNRVVGACLCGNFFSESVPEGMSEAYAAIVELHETLERPLRARLRGVGRVLMCFMVGTAMDLDHATNTAVVHLLMAHMLQDARDRGYAIVTSANSHIVTSVLTENYLDFDILDSADPAQFQFRGKSPFLRVPSGTRVTIVYRFV